MKTIGQLTEADAIAAEQSGNHTYAATIRRAIAARDHVQVEENETITDNKMQCKYLMPFKRSILYMTEQELLNAHLDAVNCYRYNINNGFEASAEMNMYESIVYAYVMIRSKND